MATVVNFIFGLMVQLNQIKIRITLKYLTEGWTIPMEEELALIRKIYQMVGNQIKHFGQLLTLFIELDITPEVTT
jgi:hypothetical protein